MWDGVIKGRSDRPGLLRVIRARSARGLRSGRPGTSQPGSSASTTVIEVEGEKKNIYFAKKTALAHPGEIKKLPC